MFKFIRKINNYINILKNFVLKKMCFLINEALMTINTILRSERIVICKDK